jgi:hypothetical protein
MDWTEVAQQTTRGVIEYAPILLASILIAVSIFCYFSFQRSELDRVDHFLFSCIAFSVLRTVFSKLLLSQSMVKATGFDKDTAHLIALLLSLLAGVCFMLLFSIAEAMARIAFIVLAMALAWSLLYGNYVMIAISSVMIVVLGCLFIKQRAVEQVTYIILGSIEYSFIIVYSVSEIVTRGSEGMEDALSDALSIKGCSKLLLCILRVSAVWMLTILRTAVCLGQKTEAQLVKEEIEAGRVRDQIARVLSDQAEDASPSASRTPEPSSVRREEEIEEEQDGGSTTDSD